MKASSARESSSAHAQAALSPNVQERIDQITSGAPLVEFPSIPLTNSDVAALATALTGNRTLDALNLQNCSLTDDHLTTILSALEGNTTLHRINLQDNKFTALGAAKLLDHVERHQSITEAAVFFHYRISSSIKRQIADAASWNACLAEERAEAAQAANGASSSAPAAAALTPGVQERINQIQSGKPFVDFHNIPLRQHDVTTIASALAGNSTLEELGLAYCSLTNRGLITILPALEGNSTLSSLHLEHNKLTDASAAVLERHMEAHESMTHVDIKGNTNISGYGKQQINFAEERNIRLAQERSRDALRAPLPAPAALDREIQMRLNIMTTPETRIEFSGIRLKDHEVMAIAKALTGNRALREISFRHCSLNDSRLATILSALEGNTVLTALELEHNKLTKESAYMLYHHIEKHESLTKISLHGNDCFPSIWVGHIDSIARKNLLRPEQQRAAQSAPPSYAGAPPPPYSPPSQAYRDAMARPRSPMDHAQRAPQREVMR